MINEKSIKNKVLKGGTSKTMTLNLTAAELVWLKMAIFPLVMMVNKTSDPNYEMSKLLGKSILDKTNEILNGDEILKIVREEYFS